MRPPRNAWTWSMPDANRRRHLVRWDRKALACCSSVLTGIQRSSAAAPLHRLPRHLPRRSSATSERVDVSRRNQPQVTTSVASNLWHALVDATQIEVAVLNLAINARDAMPLGGTICIITRNVPAAADRPSDLAPGDYVSIEVADTGEGMSEEVLEKAFEPFFTTKELGKGTGLGLSQVYGIARQSGGTARITSKLGVGTSVEIYLPRAVVSNTLIGVSLPSARAAGSPTARPVGHKSTVRLALTGFGADGRAKCRPQSIG